MIRVADTSGYFHILNLNAIAHIKEGSLQDKHNGRRAFIILFNGQVIESSDDICTLSDKISQWEAVAPKEASGSEPL